MTCKLLLQNIITIHAQRMCVIEGEKFSLLSSMNVNIQLPNIFRGICQTTTAKKMSSGSHSLHSILHSLLFPPCMCGIWLWSYWKLLPSICFPHAWNYLLDFSFLIAHKYTQSHTQRAWDYYMIDRFVSLNWHHSMRAQKNDVKMLEMDVW